MLLVANSACVWICVAPWGPLIKLQTYVIQVLHSAGEAVTRLAVAHWSPGALIMRTERPRGRGRPATRQNVYGTERWSNRCDYTHFVYNFPRVSNTSPLITPNSSEKGSDGLLQHSTTSPLVFFCFHTTTIHCATHDCEKTEVARLSNAELIGVGTSNIIEKKGTSVGQRNVLGRKHGAYSAGEPAALVVVRRLRACAVRRCHTGASAVRPGESRPRAPPPQPPPPPRGGQEAAQEGQVPRPTGAPAAGGQPQGAEADAVHQRRLRGPPGAHPDPALREATVQSGHAQAGHRLHQLPGRDGHLGRQQSGRLAQRWAGAPEEGHHMPQRFTVAVRDGGTPTPGRSLPLLVQREEALRRAQQHHDGQGLDPGGPEAAEVHFLGHGHVVGQSPGLAASGVIVTVRLHVILKLPVVGTLAI